METILSSPRALVFFIVVILSLQTLASNPKPVDEKRLVKRIKSPDAEDIVKSVKKASSQIGDVMKGETIKTVITWYTGHDLLNPFCGRESKWAPTDESLVIAVTQKWNLRPACGEFFEISVAGGKSVVARVVDLCGGCKPEVPHADLSKAAFTKLFDLDVGFVSGLNMRKVDPPKQWNEKLYGPRTL
ncbi:uncharacterized protein MELLADRAFT_105838 [Melampsora larici-populina 98AG31]|uniref:Secreted protein n=1 Tax=Melampsora larici-populina (strain 98AG31 / pathotype 3-4-7) TaxID=747676 RepID=F4RJH9_MELLP|nr:uncharacterized protein MELLADRAFT_105838 [Melampsora larici-populina 98AG31]EGG07491.1 secreted protein [Melampsora larici-populina 98AG31]